MRERKRSEGLGRIKTENVVIDDQEIEWSTNNNCGQDDARKQRRKAWFGGEKERRDKNDGEGRREQQQKLKGKEKRKKEYHLDMRKKKSRKRKMGSRTKEGNTKKNIKERR